MSSDNDLAQVVRTVTLSGGKPPREIVAKSGVDVEILEQVFEYWKIGQRHFSGYEPLVKIVDRVLFPVDVKVLENSDVDGSQDAIVLLEGVMMREGMTASVQRSFYSNLPMPTGSVESNRFAKFAIFLTRGLDWIIYTNYPERSFAIARSPAEAVRVADRRLPADTYYGNKKHELHQSIALELADQLRRSVRDSINRKKKAIDIEQPPYERMKEIMNTIADK